MLPSSWAMMVPGGSVSAASPLDSSLRLCHQWLGALLLLYAPSSMLQDSTYTEVLDLASYFFSFELVPSLPLNLSSVNFP